MDKTTKLKELYTKLESLQGSDPLPSDEVSSATGSMMDEEIATITKRLLDENPTLTILKKFNTELDKFKKDFDLKPITTLIRGLEMEIKQNQAEMAKELDSRLEEIKGSIPTLPEPFDPSPLNDNMSILRDDILAKIKDRETATKSVEQQLASITKDLSQKIEDSKVKLPEDKSGQIIAQVKKDTEEKLTALRKDILNRMSGVGGNANRAMFVTGVNVLTRYTDVNLINATAANNNTTKKVDITLSTGIGAIITGATQGSVFFAGPSGALAQDNTNLYYDDTNNQLRIGTGSSVDGLVNVPLSVVGTNTSYIGIQSQNKSTGVSASSDFVAANNIDDGSVANGHYADMGVNSSTYADPTYTLYGANDGYFQVVGGNLWLGTWTSGKSIRFYTGQIPTTGAEQMRLDASGLGIGTTPTSKLHVVGTGTYAAAGISGFRSAAHTVTLSGVNPTTYATFQANQLGAATLVGTNAGQTVTDSATLNINGASIKSTNVTLTNTYGIMISTGAVSTATNSYGLFVQAMTGATNNYGAVFSTGFVGIGPSAPGFSLDVSRDTGSGDITMANLSNTNAAGGTSLRLVRAINARAAQINFNDTWYAGILRNGGSNTTTFAISSNSDTSAGGKEFFVNAGNVSIGTNVGIGVLGIGQSTIGVGTISTTASGTTVTGVGTTFSTTFKIGDTITANGETHTITSITSGTSMATDAWTNTNNSIAYTLVGGTRMTVLGNGNVGIGTTTPTAKLHIAAGTATANTAPLKFTSGTNLTTAETGAMEYNGTNLFFTRTGTTRENIITTSAVNTVSPTVPNRTVTVVIDGTTYYLAAKTTND